MSAPSGEQPIYSIGATARMLGVDPATLRAWEDRYGIVVPQRSKGSQRLYSRDDLESLRFIVTTITDGATAADAHRLLAESLSAGGSDHQDRTVDVALLILLAERDRYAAELCEYFLRTEGYDVCAAFDPMAARQMAVERRPNLAVVELLIGGNGMELCRELTAAGTSVLAVSAIDLGDAAIDAGASGFLLKPVEPLRFVSTVRDLLGSSALARHEAAALP